MLEVTSFGLQQVKDMAVRATAKDKNRDFILKYYFSVY
ncbi:hypothetical protein ADICYQ_5426 [Cyclobacterium qasimii M12-11B]|uniref:Uncharacterized protein n=1 Tax=Cyclobacterium qasimii M12-11B TaxID=641524 RepID=S7V5Q7_9BACT|nr:hypothetical protein ADICYQ_5426 [Cyclobacterium qasimii M12-11B]